jgi:hypothetical protein
VALKRVLTRVDFPNPLSPVYSVNWRITLTYDHQSKLESLAQGFLVNLIGEVVEPDVSL